MHTSDAQLEGAYEQTPVLLQHAPFVQGIPGAQVPVGRSFAALLSKEPELRWSDPTLRCADSWWMSESFLKTSVLFE
ncbi:hypothetical protein BOTCAL_0021g00340 [Botryotinia calthae]|uniref:Uncharacterized protein n=1 Tax=Botryotinia calthae TaxID=38488 RepID=A0A4Y8DEW4_9HELO|nr:hypothetical protein BOTCAL_0021g00340 [Botryotinia calthae]